MIGSMDVIDFNVMCQTPPPEALYKMDRSATLDLVRTHWGANYASGKCFARLGQQVVNDLIHVHLKIVTGPAADGSSLSASI
jgi:hypothetical protein